MSDEMDIDPPINNHDNSPSRHPIVTYASVAKSGSSSPNTSSGSNHRTHIKGNDPNNKRKREKPYERHERSKPTPPIPQEQYFDELHKNTPQNYYESYNISDSNVDNKGVTESPINERQHNPKGQSRSIDINIINDDILNDNSKLNRCQCDTLIQLIQLNPIAGMNCCCEYENQAETVVDFDEIISENIPDNNPPIKPTVNKKRRLIAGFTIPIPPFIRSLYGYESESESDNKTTNNSKTAESLTWNSIFKSIKHLDPYYKETSTIPTSTHSHSDPRDCGSLHSSQSTATSNLTSSMSNGSNTYESSSNNNLKNPSTKTSAVQYETSRSRPIRLLVLHIIFGYKSNNKLNKIDIDKCHSKGYHSIARCFENGRFAFQFAHDSIINCWANSWKVALAVSYDSTGENMVYSFLKDIRDVFESDILDIVLVKSSYLFMKFYYLEITVADGKQEFNKILSNIVSKAYRLNKYGEEDILFYNKEEPYYEFTNFYRAQVRIDDENWPTTEHFFQAAKFHNRSLRNRIRLAYTAREAFSIARNNDHQKRKDWESPQPPDGAIFKEIIMRNALWEKFFQHVNLKHKLLSTGKAKIYEHTENDTYWGDGGRNRDGLNRLGTMLQEIRNMLMEQEKHILVNNYRSNTYNQRWVVTELQELQQFEDLIELD